MNRKHIMAAGALALLSAFAAQAASQVIESEEHYVRGLRDRTNLMTEVDKLALEKTANENIRTFARRIDAEYATSSKAIVDIAARLGIAGVGNMGPRAGGGAGPAPAAGPAPGGPGPAAGGGGRGGGPNARNQAILTALGKRDGDDFDKAYLLVAIQIHESIEREVLGEILMPAANAELVAWSKDFVVPYARNASIAQQVILGSGDGNIPVPARADDPNRKGPTVEQMTPGSLFGITIGVKK